MRKTSSSRNQSTRQPSLTKKAKRSGSSHITSTQQNSSHNCSRCQIN